jgi:hypothetical protein
MAKPRWWTVRFPWHGKNIAAKISVNDLRQVMGFYVFQKIFSYVKKYNGFSNVKRYLHWRSVRQKRTAFVKATHNKTSGSYAKKYSTLTANLPLLAFLSATDWWVIETEIIHKLTCSPFSQNEMQSAFCYKIITFVISDINRWRHDTQNNDIQHNI